MIVQIGRREEFDKKLLGEMHKLRAQVFKERKGWDVSVIDEMEIDGYDALSPYYMLIQEDTPEAQVFGCWRILDTTGPYMLKNTFRSFCTARKRLARRTSGNSAVSPSTLDRKARWAFPTVRWRRCARWPATACRTTSRRW